MSSFDKKLKVHFEQKHNKKRENKKNEKEPSENRLRINSLGRRERLL